MASWRRITGVAGLAAGAAAAGAGAILAAERIAVGHVRVIRSAAEPEPLGSLRGRVLTVLADDGVPLHVEIDEPPGAGGPREIGSRKTGGRKTGGRGIGPRGIAPRESAPRESAPRESAPRESGPRESGTEQSDPLTIIFCHGYTLNQDSWHFQRRDLGAHRLVFWDQRDHGRSGRSADGPASVERLGADLELVIKAVAPGDMPVVLVGHSMGGMTIMALAGRDPGLFGTKVTGVALIATAAGGLDGGSPWMPAPLRLVLRRALPVVLRSAATGYRAILVERARRAAGDLAFLSTRYMGFGDPGVNPAVVDFLEQMIRSTPMDVVAKYSQALYEWDMRATLPVLARVPVSVIIGERDRLIPPALGLEVAAQVPSAELVWVPGAGHAVMLERPDIVNESITALVARAAAGTESRERSA
jgi:pimeloyl-ACP methyl ester carboxylesterase